MTVTSRSARVTLPSDEQILIVREFDAPRRLVWKAFTTPELVQDGIEVAFHGEYLEVVPEERLVTRELYEGLPEGVSEQDAETVNIATLEEVDGSTTLTILVQAGNRISRDAIIESGMEDGLQDALDLLEETAVSLD